MTFGEALRALRKKKGLTLREVAARAGITVAYLCDLEHGRRGCPRLVVVNDICELLGDMSLMPIAARERYGNEEVALIWRYA